MIDEINVGELINKLVKISLCFKNNIKSLQELKNKVYETSYDIFIVLVELKLQHPFVKEMINLNLNVELIFEIHEIVRPVYQSTNIFQTASKTIDEITQKTVKEKRQPFMEELAEKSSKRMIKNIKNKKAKTEIDLGIGIEEEEKRTARSDTDELDSDVSFLQKDPKKKKHSKFRI